MCARVAVSTSGPDVPFDDGKGLVGQGLTGTIGLDVSSRTTIWTLNLRQSTGAAATPCVVAARTDRVYCGDPFGRLEEHEVSTGGLIRIIDAQNGNVGSLWMARNDTELVSFADEVPIVSRWRVDGSGLISRRIASGHTPVSYSPDGKLLIAYREPAAFDQTPDDPVVLDLATGEVIDPLDGFVAAWWSGNRTLIGASLTADGIKTIVGYDLDTGATRPSNLSFPVDESFAFQGNWRCFERSSCTAITFENKRTLWMEMRHTQGDSTNFESEIWAIDKETLQRVEPTFRLTWLRTASATDDGSRLVITMESRNGVAVVDGRSGDLLAEIVGNRALGTTTPKSAVVAPGGTIIAADFQGRVTIYDSETLEVLHVLSGTRGDTEIQVSADGSLALARGGDHSFTLYDVATGEQLGDRLTTFDTEVVASAMRADGKEVAIGGGFDDGILVWDLDPQHWVAAACELADRNLTQAEWDTYIGDLATYHDTCPDIEG